MEIFDYLREYKAFMNWFELRYPGLFQLYGNHIAFPVNAMGIMIKIENLSGDDMEKLTTLRQEFYRHK